MSSEPEVALERRQTPRKHSPVNKILQAELSLDEGEPSRVYLFLVDVSVGGLRVNADQELPGEAVFGLAFPVDGFGEEVKRLAEDRLSLRCQVVWKRELIGGTWVHGLQFVDLDEPSAAAVAAMMEAFSPAGRRKRFRLNRLLPIALKPEDAPAWTERFASDLSPEGLGVQLDGPLPQDQDILVKIFPEFDLPVVESKARVAWLQETASGKCRVGLEFVDLDGCGAQVLQQYIDRCLKIR